MRLLLTEVIILKLSEEIPQNRGFRRFFDNWFSTSVLMVQIKTMGILRTATLRTKHVKQRPLPSDKELNNESYDYGCNVNSRLHVSKWYDHCRKMKFSLKDFFSKCYQIRSLLHIWSHSLKKSLMENFIFFV